MGDFNNKNDLTNGNVNIKEMDTLPSQVQWLQNEALGFSLCGDQIKVLFSPEEFYSSLIEGCCKAKRRIALAALYIGTGTLEQKLVEVLDKRIRECGQTLNVTILLDNVRASRDQSARTILLPLITNHPHCQVSLYHNPELRGLWLHLLPSKVDEAIGIQHIKIYIFDDDIIISGANLTKEYFRDRQDRYMLISDCQPLADFCHGLIQRLSSISLRLTEDNTLVPRQPHLHPYHTPLSQYVKHAREIVWGYYQEALRDAEKKPKPGADTWLFPVLQLPPLQVQQDSHITQAILESASPDSTVQLTSPYFNLPDNYIKSLLHKCKAACVNILIPHPTVIDFFGAPGLAGHIPYLYNSLSVSFLQYMFDIGQTKRVTVEEFTKPGGSYHCKGVWLTEKGEDKPYLTIMGSSNFNHRSVKRDLEYQLVVVTSNNALRESLKEESSRLYKCGVPFTREVACRPDRKPKFIHYWFSWLFKGYL